MMGEREDEIRDLGQHTLENEEEPSGVSNEEESPTDQRYPLHAAARRGQVDTLLSLIQTGSHQAVNQANFDSVTPLHEACLAGNAECVKILLNSGATVDARNIDGGTP